MSNDKPVAIAIIKFYANKHVEVKLDTIRGITPRTLGIAGNILQRTYVGMKSKYIAEEHKRVREEKARKVEEAEEDESEYHIKEDERLLAAALEDMPSGDGGDNDGDNEEDNESKVEDKSVLAKIKDTITG